VPSGDGALVSWFTISEASTAAWDTRALNLEGTPRSAIVPHLSFPTMAGVYTDVMSLAVTPQCAFGGLVDDVASGCRFLPLDGDGNEIGPVVSLHELHENTNRYPLFLMELNSLGETRGAPTAFGIYDGIGNVHILLVRADGERALLVYSGAPMSGMGGVGTLPLACAAH
jgi:hypothetical protein